MHLVRKPAGRDNRDTEVFGVALDRLAERLSELVAAPGTRDRHLQHADLKRHDRTRPGAIIVPHHGQRRQASVIERLALEEAHVELVGDECHADMARQCRVPPCRRNIARPAAFVRRDVGVINAERECRVVVEEERGDVIVVDHEQHIDLLTFHPVAHLGKALEDRRPGGVVLLVVVPGESDGRRMRRADAPHDLCHVRNPSPGFGRGSRIRDRSAPALR